MLLLVAVILHASIIILSASICSPVLGDYTFDISRNGNLSLFTLNTQSVLVKCTYFIVYLMSIEASLLLPSTLLCYTDRRSDNWLHSNDFMYLLAVISPGVRLIMARSGSYSSCI